VGIFQTELESKAYAMRRDEAAASGIQLSRLIFTGFDPDCFDFGILVMRHERIIAPTKTG
jgi:hypothetical protein